MRKTVLAVVLCCMHAWAFASNSVECLDPLSKMREKALAQLVGNAVLYPMDEKSFGKTVSCLLSQYVRSDVAVAGLKWDITHGLLRVMAADPIQFLDVASRQDATALERWLQSFGSAALWPRDRCPKLDPMTLARRSVENLHLELESSEALRKRVAMLLKQNPCVVAN